MTTERHFSLIHRLLHWAIAFTVLFILLTVFLRLGWMDKNYMASLMLATPELASYSITQDDAVMAAKSIRNAMYGWHLYAGYLMAFLLAARLYHMRTKGLTFKGPLQSGASLRERFQGAVYLVFYFFLTLSVLTGLTVRFAPEFIADFAEQIHVLALWYLIPYLVLHFGGIILGELTKEKGIVSKMIGG